MTIERKVGMGIAGQPSGATDVADVFSTYLYDGTNNAKTITNGIDLAGEGGMVWTKARDGSVKGAIVDTVRGPTKYLEIDTSTEATTSVGITAFNSNGYSLGADDTWKFNVENAYVSKYASWTFRKKEKFFDVVTYTGSGVVSTGAGAQAIAHSLGSVPAMIIFKSLTTSEQWPCYHKDVGNQHYMRFSGSNAKAASAVDMFNATSPTDTHFTVGTDNEINKNGESYVAYLFADNSSEDAEDQMIECGSYTGTGASVGASVTLGWEPQFVLVKAASAGGSWATMDTMRGIPNGSDNPTLFADTSAAEVAQANWLEINSTGFKTLNGNYGNGNASGVTYIYMAIRAPMMVEPEAATDVFAIDTWGSTGDGKKPALRSGFPVDLAIRRNTAGGNVSLMSRLTGGNYFRVNTTNQEAYDQVVFDYNNGYYGATDTNAAFHAYMWKRAKGYMDVVAYTGVSGSPQVINHSLGVTPEMIWTKSRSTTGRWLVLHKDLTYALAVQTDGAETGSIQINTPTSTSFTAADSSIANGAGVTYIAYLFATLDGISKVGSYTGNGSSQTISCGFSAGSRFILIKRTDATGDWYIWNSVRGIVAGNDPHLSLNTTAAQVTTDDSVDPHNSGFIVNQVSATNINVSSATYIFYAIA